MNTLVNDARIPASQLSLLIFQLPEPKNISEIGPWIDRRISPPVETLFAALDAQTHRRFMKAHLPFDGLPSFDEVRYIHVARDGRDACLSYHNQITRFRPEVREALDRIGMEDEPWGVHIRRSPPMQLHFSARG